MTTSGTMKVVYVAGRFRAPTAWGIKQNVYAAEHAGLQVAECGAMPLIPHKNTENFHGLLNDPFWLLGTQELLRRSDAAYVFDLRWRQSDGTVGEVDLARSLNIPVFFNLEDLRGWLQTVDGRTKTPEVLQCLAK